MMKIVFVLVSLVSVHSLVPNVLKSAIKSPTALGMFQGFKNPFSAAKDTKNDLAARKSAKEEIIALSQGTSNGVKASDLSKSKIEELVKCLEKLNPTKKITDSPLLDGVWNLVYTTNEGSSAGKVGPFIGEVTQDIRLSESFYSNNVKLFNGVLQASLGASWDVLSPNLWRVKFLNIKFSLLGSVLSSKSLEGTTGIWRTSYLDESFRILYAIGGKNTTKENVYILRKNTK